MYLGTWVPGCGMRETRTRTRTWTRTGTTTSRRPRESSDALHKQTRGDGTSAIHPHSRQEDANEQRRHTLPHPWGASIIEATLMPTLTVSTGVLHGRQCLHALSPLRLPTQRPTVPLHPSQPCQRPEPGHRHRRAHAAHAAHDDAALCTRPLHSALLPSAPTDSPSSMPATP
jgi:hypothetical protein